MPTRETEPRGVGEAAKVVAEHASQIARLELELAMLELKRKLTSLGLGIGLGAGALLFVLYGIGFTLATIAAAIATALPWWAALLIVTVGLFLSAALLGLLAYGRIKKGTPPVPEQAILEAKLTTEAIKGNGSSG